MFKAREYLLFLVILVLMGGCADSSTKGNIEEHETTQTITIDNRANGEVTVNFPVEYASKETSAVDQTTQGTSNVNPESVLNLADKAAQIASGAAQLKDALTNLDESNRPQDSYNPVTTTPATVAPATVAPVPVPTPTTTPTEPAEPADPDMHGFTHKKTIENTGDKMSYRSGDEESVDQDKFVFKGTLGDDYGTGGGLLVFSDGNKLSIPNMTSMAMLPKANGYRKWQPGGKYSGNNPSIPWAEAYASRYTHPASVTLYYNGTGTADPVEPVGPVFSETGEYKGRTDTDNRPVWNFSKAMKNYPDSFMLSVEGCYEGMVTNNGSRWDAPGNVGYVIKQSDKSGWNTALFGPASCTSEKASFSKAVDPVNPTTASPINMSEVEWLHTNVSGWSQTATLKSVSTTSGTITLDYDKAKVWPGVTISSNLLNANPWIFVKQDGKWYAGTWEWFRSGQTTKSKSAVAGDHIKQDPLKSFKPVVGETYGFMVSGLARHSERNVEERSNIVMYTWE